MSQPDRPVGTVTFLFTDIEGSTRRWEQFPEQMSVALARHDAIMRGAIESNNGFVFKTVGDAFCAAFDTAPRALAGSLAAQKALNEEPWGEVGELRVRMALHTGAAELRDDDYFGPTLNRVARLLSAGHGGQVLLSFASVELTRDTLPTGASLRDLGEHRLKDLVRPEHVFQLVHPELPEEFPPLRGLDVAPNNLPIQATPFVGREHELTAARNRLLQPAVRLLTLTGPGGTGKTRLALQVAADLIDQFEQGVFFVPLATISDPELVPATIAQELGLQEGTAKPLKQLLKEYLADREILLVLDNFEQIVDASSLLAELLAACPRLKLLVTSRAVLRLYWEHEFPVPPLTMPDPRNMPPLDRLNQFEAVRLFVERALAVKPDFAVTNENAPAVAEICQRLDGLPLAIELAAARTRLLSPQAILSRLEHRLPLLVGGSRDLPVRQQTLRAAIAWGYDLLDEDDQRLFRRLAVFVEGWTLAAAEAICGDDVDALDGTDSLVSKSLLQQSEEPGGEPRFSMLGTIREFGLEQLDISGEGTEVHQRHADHFERLSEEAEPRLRGPEQAGWLERLESENENIKSALSWFVRTGETERALDLVANLRWFYYLRSHLTEGRALVDGILSKADPRSRTRPRARALLLAGSVRVPLGEFEVAQEQLREAAAIFAELGLPVGEGYCLSYIGMASYFHGNYAAAQEVYAQAEALLRRSGEQWGLALVLFFGGNAALSRGDDAEARAKSEEAHAIFRLIGDRWGVALPLVLLAHLALKEGDLPAARSQFEAALEIRRETGDKWGAAHVLNGLGDVARAEKDYAGAMELYTLSRKLFRESGGQSGVANSLYNLGSTYLSLEEHDQARSHLLQSLMLYREMGELRGVAECLAGLARVEQAEGKLQTAAVLLAATEALLKASGLALWPANQASYEQSIAAIRQSLDPDILEKAWLQGRSLSVDQAVERAQAAD